MKHTYVTVLSTDNYLPGVMALNKNISELCCHPLLVLASRDLRDETYTALQRENIPFILGDDVVPQKELLRATEEHPWYSHWAKSFLKLRIFDLVEYDKIVFIDCDILLLEPVDELFECPCVSAVIAGKSFPGNDMWVDLNSGLMVIEPQKGTSEQMAAIIPEVAEVKGIIGDQDVIQAYLTGWRTSEELHIPGGYNVYFAHYQYYLKNEFAKAVHFTGRKKPWMLSPLDLLKEYVKCLIRGNTMGIPILRKYLELLREAGRQ